MTDKLPDGLYPFIDSEAVADLETLGWQVLTVWQSKTKDTETSRKRVVEFLANG